MTNRFFYRIIGLTALYTCIIVGIFALQFRNESTVRRVLGNFRFVVSYQKDENQQTVLSNAFQLTYKDLHLFFDNKNPVQLYIDNNTVKSLKLQSFEENDSSVTLIFDNNTELVFSSSNESCTIRAVLPTQAQSLSISYKLLNSLQKTVNEHSIMLSTRKDQYILSGLLAAHNTSISLSNATVAEYTLYTPTQEFTLASIQNHPLAQSNAYQSTIINFRETALSSFKRSLNATVTEKTVIAYVAEMGSRNLYDSALSTVPEIFKTGPNRTYMSAPFFNSLARMEGGYQTELQAKKAHIAESVLQESADVFIIPQLLPALVQNNQTALISNIAAIAQKHSAQLSVLQAAGILKLYADMIQLSPSSVSLFEKILTICEKTILKAFSSVGDLYIISWNKNTVNTISALTVAQQLISYGHAAKNPLWQQAGFLLINSIFAINDENTALMEEYTFTEESSVLTGNRPINPSTLYPILVTDNTYYPHTTIITTGSTNQRGGGSIAAWTIAQNISCQTSGNTTTISATFPQGQTHHMIITGIEPFSRIQLYGVDYRTDPQFETYNSSGYIYMRDSKTLLLKMRHRSLVENITLIY